MSKYAIPAFAALSLAFAVGWVLVAQTPRTPAAPAVQPPEAPSTPAIAAVGLVEPETESIELSCAVSGLVTKVFVSAGDRVKAQQKLFSIDDRDLQADLQVKRAAVESARANLDKLARRPRPEEIPPAEAKVAEAKALVADAEAQLQRIESVSDRRAVREEDVTRRRFSHHAAKARLLQAEAEMKLLMAGAWAPDVAIARSQLAEAEASLKQVETGIERLTVRAPVNGQILQSKVRPGQYATCGPLIQPLIVLGGGKHWHVRADVDEGDASKVRARASAVASARGNPKLKFHLDFVRFEPYVIPKKSLTGDPTERVDTRVLQVIYRFRDSNPSVYSGQQMDVFIDSPGGTR